MIPLQDTYVAACPMPQVSPMKRINRLLKALIFTLSISFFSKFREFFYLLMTVILFWAKT